MTPAYLNHLYIVLLLIAIGIGLFNACLMLFMWWKHHELSVRTTRLETISEQSLTHAEVRQIFEKISSLEGQLKTSNQMLRTVQEYLLESDK